jgi:peptidoglycan/xylan/chitin deacetylase (PgdA/CDA1 family)
MRIKIAVKRCFASILYRSHSIPKRLQRLSGVSYCILLYHRINRPDENGVFIQPGMYVTPETFEMHMRSLQSEATVLPLDELITCADRGMRLTSSRPFCAITFDDGWRDFYDNAYPVLKSLNVPATVFLPTSYIGTDQWFWTDRLAYLWKWKRRLYTKSSNQIVHELMRINGPFASQIEKAIALLKKQPLAAIESLLAQLETACGGSCPVPGRAFLNWQEVKEMRSSGLIAFGSHTAEHPILTTLGEQEIKYQLNKSRQKLVGEDVVDAHSISFCYPNGNYNDRIAQLVKEAGYSYAVTTKKGWNSESSDPFALKRIGIHQDITATMPMFFSRIAGLFT